jgi:hypothetical protein
MTACRCLARCAFKGYTATMEAGQNRPRVVMGRLVPRDEVGRRIDIIRMGSAGSPMRLALTGRT